MDRSDILKFRAEQGLNNEMLGYLFLSYQAEGGDLQKTAERMDSQAWADGVYPSPEDLEKYPVGSDVLGYDPRWVRQILEQYDTIFRAAFDQLYKIHETVGHIIRDYIVP